MIKTKGMKRATFFGLILGGWLLGGACSDNDKSLDKFISNEVEITDLELILPSSGKDSESTIITSDHPWSLEGESDWCTITPRSAGPGTTTIYVTLLPNEDYDDRSVTLTLHTSAGDKPLTIYQKKKDAIIFAKDRFDNVGMEGGEIEVALQANVAYRVEIPTTNSWIHPRTRAFTRGLVSSVETFDIDATRDFNPRSGIIVFINTENEKMRDTVTVYQVQRDQIILESATVRVPLEGETIRVPVRSNIVYEVNIPAEITWIHQEASNRADEIRLLVDPSAADRQAVITIRDKNNHALSSPLTIQQEEKETLKFKDDSADVPRLGGTVKLVVEENIAGKYKIIVPEYAPWIKQVEAPASMDSHDVWIEIEENGSDELAREGRVLVQGTENTDLLDIFVVRQAGGRVPESDERITLIKLAESLDFPNWQNNWQEKWQITNPLNKWEGVVTDASGLHVVSLTFSTLSNGHLTKEIGDLLYLEELRLEVSPNISGALPPQIANLKNLQSLTFSGGKFEGIIPELGALTAMKSLSISGGFSGQPGAHLDAIGWLENLEQLELRNGSYGSAVPATWGNLKKLQRLTLNGVVDFTNVDPIGGMTALRTLDLSYMTTLTGNLPESLGNLSELTEITLNHVGLSGLPQSFGDLSKLGKLYISETEITQLPTSVENLKALRELTLTKNKLTALPEALSGMTSLVTLDISGNPNLAGELPTNIGNLANLTKFVIENNAQLTGAIPESISRLQRLTDLRLAGNAFTAIPSTIGAMTNLTTIYLAGNDFQEPIPESIGNLTKLTSLDISRANKDQFKGLIGTIPASIGSIATLQYIELQNNQLSGSIPTTIGDLKNLRRLRLQNNELTGTLPGTLSTLTNLSEIRLENNGLSGSLPVDFRDFGGIQILNLYNNNFEGAIPEGFQGKAQAYQATNALLDLRLNKLSGAIPESFINRTELDTLHFKYRPQKQGFGFTN
jgi:Leucine-rich repeat (LRR) protein